MSKIGVNENGLGVYNVKTYGATGDNVTDDSAAINSAIAAAFNAGGGVVYFPPGTYLCNGPFQDTSNANSILWVPYNPTRVGGTPAAAGTGDWTAIPTIEFRGPVSPGMSYNDNIEGSAPPPTTGAVIRTTKTGTGTGPALLSGGKTQFPVHNWLRVTITNLTFRTHQDSGLRAVDLSGVEVCAVEHVCIDRDVPATSLVVTSATNDIALNPPPVNNGASLYFRNIWIDGYYIGMNLTEHCNVDDIVFQHCTNAMVTMGGNHAVLIGRVLVQCCKKVLVGAANSIPIRIELLDVEHLAGLWGTTTDIDDGGNLMHGSIASYVVVTGGTGPGGTLAKVGATNLTIGASLF